MLEETKSWTDLGRQVDMRAFVKETDEKGRQRDSRADEPGQ